MNSCSHQSAVEQHTRARTTELVEPRLPGARDLFRVVRATDALFGVGVCEQTYVVVNLPVLRVEASERDRHLKPRADWTEDGAVCDDDVDAAALHVFENGRARREAHGHEAHARQC